MPTKKQQPKSVLSQLQSVGEGAIERITQNQATRSALQGAIHLRDRGEQLVTGIVAIEKRLLAVEKRLAALEGQGSKRVSTTARSAASKARATTTSTARTTAAKARSAASKPKPGA